MLDFYRSLIDIAVITKVVGHYFHDYTNTYIHIYVHTHTHIYIYIYMYMYICYACSDFLGFEI